MSSFIPTNKSGSSMYSSPNVDLFIDPINTKLIHFQKEFNTLNKEFDRLDEKYTNEKDDTLMLRLFLVKQKT